MQRCPKVRLESRTEGPHRDSVRKPKEFDGPAVVECDPKAIRAYPIADGSASHEPPWGPDIGFLLTHQLADIGSGEVVNGELLTSVFFVLGGTGEVAFREGRSEAKADPEQPIRTKP